MKKSLLTAVIATLLVAPAAFAVRAETSPAATNANTKVRAAATATNQEIKAKIELLKSKKAEERTELEAEVLVKSKERTNDAIDKAVAKYKKTKTRINGMPNISDEQKTAVAEKIDDQIAKVEALKTEVESATTVQEVKSVVTKLKTEMRKSFSAVKEAVKAIHATHLGNLVTRLNEIKDKLEGRVAELEIAGKDVTELKALAAKAEESLVAADNQLKTYEFEKCKDSLLVVRQALVELAQEVKAQEATTSEVGEE